MLTGPVTKSGNTPIEVAVHKGKLEVIKYLVTEQGVDMSGKCTGLTILLPHHSLRQV